MRWRKITRSASAKPVNVPSFVMKPTLFFFPLLPVFTALASQAAQPEYQPPPPIVQGPAPVRPDTPFGPPPDNQHVYGPSGATLVARETPNGILEKFHQVYASTNAPRVVIYAN